MFHSNQGHDFYDNVDKTNGILKNRFDSQSIYNNKCIKTKTKSCNGKMKTDFHDKKIPEAFHYICLMVILMDSVLKNDDKYYPQVLLEKCKYIIKEKKKHSYIEEE